MAKFYSGIDTSVGLGAETLDGMLANGSTYGISPSQDIDCENINASGIHTVGGFFYPNGGIKDSSDSTGTSGKVLSSTGSGLAWIDPSEGSTANAVNVGTNLDSTNADQFVAFMGSSSGNNPVRVDTDLKYNPSTNVLSVKGITLPGDGQKISIGADNPLEIQHSSISSQVEFKSDAIISIMSGSAIELENESGGNIARFVKSSGCELYHNVSGTSTVRLETTTAGVTITGDLTADGVQLPDLKKLELGDNQELKMFHKDDTNDVRVELESNTNYILLTKTFDLKDAAGSKAAITATNPGGVPEVLLYHDGNERLKTTNDGVTITGDLTVADIIATGNIDLGSDTSDTLTISAHVDSDIVPSGTTRDLGGNSNRWRNLYVKTIKDKDNQSGSSGQVLSSTGTELDWINIGDVAAGSAAQVAVSDESSDTTCFPLFTTGDTGNQSPKSGSNLTFNSSTGALSATSFSGSIAASNINSGTLGTDRIPNLAASKITSGTLGTARIPNLAASKITSGQLDAARIPTLNQDTTGNAATATSATTAATVTTAAQTNITSLGTLTGLNVNGTLNVQNGNTLDFGTATNNGIRGQIQATETNDAHLIIATSGGEDIAFKDGGVNGTTNMIIRGDGNVLVNNGSVTATSFSGSGANLTGIFVTGMILLWSGAANAIPSGWVLCDGNNSTPDLRNKFVVGANTSSGDTTYPGLSVGASGGESTKTLGTANLPSHTHTDGTLTATGGDHNHSYNQPSFTTYAFTGGAGSQRCQSSGSSSTGGSGSLTMDVSGTTGDQGGTMGQAFDILPPYYALCYIMKT